MKPINVLIVDDSAFMRKLIRDTISSDDQLLVKGIARNGKDALLKIKQLEPDVVLLDVVMPEMDGMTVLREIMRDTPLPVIMISGAMKDVADKTVQAITNGAVDFVAKPSDWQSFQLNEFKDSLVSKVIAASNIKGRQSKLKIEPAEQMAPLPQQKQTANTIVAIGTSTGGPRALERVLTELPADFQSPILIVQHMPAKFTKSLAERLNRLSQIHVKEAEHGEVLKAKTAYIAPGDFHLRVKQTGKASTVLLSEEAPHNGHRPSVDVLFDSFAELININKIAVVMTGMGRDGTEGVKQLKRLDPTSIVIAESEASAIVYGMPKSVVNTKQVNLIKHLDQIGETLEQLITGREAK